MIDALQKGAAGLASDRATLETSQFILLRPNSRRGLVMLSMNTVDCVLSFELQTELRSS
jgi:hypothetical protein